MAFGRHGTRPLAGGRRGEPQLLLTGDAVEVGEDATVNANPLSPGRTALWAWNKKGHVHGTNVSGGHSTLIDGADAIVKKLGVLPWFESVRPGVISAAKGGKPSVTIRRHADATHVNTVKLTFRTKGSVQGMFLQRRDLESSLPTIVSDIIRAVGKGWRGAAVMIGRLSKVLRTSGRR